jgi:ATP-dependent protease ClpP protease subunit
MDWCCPDWCVDSYTFGTIVDHVKVFKKEVFFTSKVDTESIELLVGELIKLADKSVVGSLSGQESVPTRVTLYIDSPGGSIKDVLKFVDYVRILRKSGRLHLTTVVVGLAASAATIMASMGDERYVTSSSICKIRELFSGNVGTYTQLTSGMKNLQNMQNIIVDIFMSTNSKIKKTVLLDMLTRETWFTAKEYVEAGFADAVYEDKIVK